MIRTPICDVLGIDVPIVQAGMGVFTSAELVAAVSNAGALGSLGAGLRPPHDLARQLTRIRELTDAPFAVNFTLNSEPDQQAIEAAISARPAVMSFALGDPGELVAKAHAAGALVMHQVTTVQQATRALARGVDVLIAQGSESGGFGGTVATLPLVPQIVDVAGETPVLAAGGVADGRGLAAIIAMGAQGVNMGTRFLATVEAPVDSAWKQLIVAASSEETVKFDVWGDIFPRRPEGYAISPRTLRTPFVNEWIGRPDDAASHAEELRGIILAAVEAGSMHELMPWVGETVGLIDRVLPAAEIVRRVAAEADAVLSR
jgi:enoyl-[acyl-carrier protein] reductase II